MKPRLSQPTHAPKGTIMHEKAFATDNGIIHYWVSAHIEDAPQLVFLPGLTADHRLFDRQIAHFEHRADCLVWDPPSHGASRPFALNWSMDDLARMLHAILEREGFTRPILIGQSMGGYVAQAFLDLFPGKAAGFASIDSCPLACEYYTAAELWALKHTRGLYQAFPWRLLCRAGSRGCATTEYGRALMREMMTSYGKREYVDLAAHGYRALAIAVEVSRPYMIDCPTLLICGEQDAAGSAKRYNRTWARQTGLPLEWIAGAGHNSNTDAPDQVNALIEMFVEKCLRDDEDDPGRESPLSQLERGARP